MKRAFDIALAILVFVAVIPLFGVVAVAVFVSLGSPVFFFQQRAGLDGKPFVLIKFRSMSSMKSNSESEDDSCRLNGFGRFLRATSLDEMPQLINIMKGDMSFVGPRPLLLEYLPLYSEDQSLRHSVRPGLTGWAQVNGRNSIDWKIKLELDVWYVKNQSLSLDIKILVLTIIAVFSGKGIQSDGYATSKKFDGN